VDGGIRENLATERPPKNEQEKKAEGGLKQRGPQPTKHRGKNPSSRSIRQGGHFHEYRKWQDKLKNGRGPEKSAPQHGEEEGQGGGRKETRLASLLWGMKGEKTQNSKNHERTWTLEKNLKKCREILLFANSRPKVKEPGSEVSYREERQGPGSDHNLRKALHWAYSRARRNKATKGGVYGKPCPPLQVENHGPFPHLQ